MQIGIFRDYRTQRILFAYNNGSYSIYGDSISFGSILPNEFVDVTLNSDKKINLKKGTIDLGNFDKIFYIGYKWEFRSCSKGITRSCSSKSSVL